MSGRVRRPSRRPPYATGALARGAWPKDSLSVPPQPIRSPVAYRCGSPMTMQPRWGSGKWTGEGGMGKMIDIAQTLGSVLNAYVPAAERAGQASHYMDEI